MEEVVEHAKSGRSTCWTCSAKIEMRGLRVGTVPDVGSDGTQGFTMWHHATCFPFRGGDHAMELDGYFQLSKANQKYLVAISKAPAGSLRTNASLQSQQPLSQQSQSSQQSQQLQSSQQSQQSQQTKHPQHPQQRPSTASNAVAAVSPGVWQSLPAVAADGASVDAEYREEHDVLYGVARVPIVGVQHYAGVIHAGELAVLVREPTNRYDRNAMRVDNLAGMQVGHMKATVAVVLAPLADDASPAAPTLEAVVVQGGTGYQLPADVRILGLPEHARRTLAYLAFHRIPLVGGFAAEVAAAAAAAQRATAAPRAGAAGHVTQTVKVDATAQSQRELDAVFDAIGEELASAKTADVATLLGGAESTVKTPLLAHQLQAVVWMLAKESGFAIADAAASAPGGTDLGDSPLPALWEARLERGRTVYFNAATNTAQPDRPPRVRGGIIADAMGLGKTLTTLALICARDGAAARAEEASVKTEEPETKPKKGGKAKKAKPKKGEPVAKPVESVKEEEPAEKPPGAPRKQTLVVCPTSVLSNWTDQVRQHTHLRASVYHGADRKIDPDADIVVTTYGTLTAEAPQSDAVTAPAKKTSQSDTDKVKKAAKKPAKRPRGVEGAFAVSWERVVLDEAHVIRNARTKAFAACHALETRHRWCLTGTPIVNKPEDLAALFRFLRAQPVDDPQVFSRAISRPLKEGDPAGVTRLRVLVRSLALRRPKALLAAVLVPKTVETRLVDIGHENRAAYNALFKTARACVEALGDDALRAYGSVLECITRLRQLCSGGASLVPAKRLAAARRIFARLGLDAANGAKPLSKDDARGLLDQLQKALGEAEAAETFECSICLDDVVREEARVLKQCKHIFCATCSDRLLHGTAVCALCRAPFLSHDLISPSQLQAAVAPESAETERDDLVDDSAAPSPKVSALVAAVAALPTEEKAVAFSAFVGTIQRAQKAFEDAGILAAQLVGSMSAAQRVKVLADFARTDGGAKVLLVSIQAGGTGLNLDRANHVYVLDPWWNASVEEQAMDRVHRLSQTRPVTAVRFVAARTIEERIVALQNSKKALGEAALAKMDPDQVRANRLGDITRLFDPFE